MTDTVDPATRSRMMAGIRGRNTKPEVKVRKALHALGFRFARNSKGLPGRPDLVLPRWKVAVFVNGCFWHWHGCHLSRIPASNAEFWLAKLTGNRARDVRVVSQLLGNGWRVLTVWECSLRGSAGGAAFDADMLRVAGWIRGNSGERTMVVPSVHRTD